ncbi:unnamed protein product [Acidocella sp. C78]|nr:unnamed protein product [Acidocella sp. C78]
MLLCTVEVVGVSMLYEVFCRERAEFCAFAAASAAPIEPAVSSAATAVAVWTVLLAPPFWLMVKMPTSLLNDWLTVAKGSLPCAVRPKLAGVPLPVPPPVPPLVPDPVPPPVPPLVPDPVPPPVPPLVPDPVPPPVPPLVPDPVPPPVPPLVPDPVPPPVPPLVPPLLPDPPLLPGCPPEDAGLA